MVCTKCQAETMVANSRHQKRINSVWRRRKCRACGYVFSTIEQADYEKIWQVSVIGGKPRPFMRDKLFISVYKSVQHRPAALNDALSLTATIIAKIHTATEDNVITSTAIATIVRLTLQRFDKAAATMYAAYHADSLGD